MYETLVAVLLIFRTTPTTRTCVIIAQGLNMESLAQRRLGTYASDVRSIDLEISIGVRLVGTDDLLDRDGSQGRLASFLLETSFIQHQ